MLRFFQGLSSTLCLISMLMWVVAPSALAVDSPKSDMRVLIDISGSMKKNDPQNLRIPAVKLLLNLAPDDSQFGMWTFGQYVNNLVPIDTVSKAWKKQAVGKADAINSAGLFTNIGAALERAQGKITKPDAQWDRTLVLLSDGMVDISKKPEENQQEKQRILEQVVPALKEAGFRIHAVALSDESDKEFLKSLAVLTGGSFSLADSADDLLAAFVEASDQLNKPEQVPMIDNQFIIDESVKEFTALIFHEPDAKPTQLVAPSGQAYSAVEGSRNINWFADNRYDLITVFNPEPGLWSAKADIAPGNRVTVISDLTLQMRGLPDNALEGEKLNMRLTLEENGRAIVNPDFLGLLDITFSQETEAGERFEGKLAESGNSDLSVPADGVYEAKLGRTITPGRHQFEVVVDGKTFKRTKKIVMQVHHEVLEVEHAYRDHEGEVLQYLQVKPRAGLVQPEQIEIVAQIVDPKGEKSLQNAILTKDGGWDIDVPPYGALGPYEVLLKVSGTSTSDKSFELIQGPYVVDYSPITALPADASMEPPLDLNDDTDQLVEEPIQPELTEIPSLDVEELPPEDMDGLNEKMLEQDIVENNQQILMDDTAEQVPVQEEDESRSWVTILGVVLANLAVIGGGVFYYLRFLKKSEQEQSQVVQEITHIQQQRKELAKAQSKDAEPGSEPVPEPSSEAAVPSDMEEDATLISTAKVAPDNASESEPELAQKPASENPVEAAVPEAPPEDTYVNDAAPMELEQESTVEVDDDPFEEGFTEMESMEELDMMLADQEDGAQAENEDQLNQTIDEMLEQPTVFPAQRDKPKEQSEDEEEDEKKRKDQSFDDDEFMLDDPNKK